MRPLDEQTILVTGSTDGHGRRVAEELVGRGATVLVHGRDLEKVARVDRRDRRRPWPDGGPVAAGRRAGARRRGRAARHAGQQRRHRHPRAAESADGNELTFAVNYLSHFLLTALLLDKLREPARIVNVSSIGQHPLDLDDLAYEQDFNGYYAYARSKLAQVLFTRRSPSASATATSPSTPSTRRPSWTRRWCSARAGRR